MSSPVRLQRPSNLSLDSVKPKSRVTFKEDSHKHTADTSPTPRKFRNDNDFRMKRKRAHSCSFSWDHALNKRRKTAGAIVLPTKFLLGGNITDPLNLKALDNGDCNKNNENAIGGGCRRGSTVRVIIPPNINDPLNLGACSEDGEEQLADAISRQRRRRKSKKRKRRNSEPGGITYDYQSDRSLCTSLDDGRTPNNSFSLEVKSSTPIACPPKDSIDNTVVSECPITSLEPLVPSVISPIAPSMIRVSSEPHKESSPIPAGEQGTASATTTPRHPPPKRQRSKSDNKIVSPVVPQPGVERKRHYSRQSHPSVDNPSRSRLNPPKHFHPKNACFQYGNYNQYYGYRNSGLKTDPRLKVFDKDWFQGKEVLDIGCNIGHITLSIARDFGPRKIVGIDVDKKLVKIAQKNVKHYMGNILEAEDKFPSSMKLLYGPLRPPVDKGGRVKFPHNVKFCQSNYVLENDALLETVRPTFDVILCLSVTKWVHLNWGDEGLKRFFRRIIRNLKPGGILILEPQAWPSYSKKRKLTNEIFENYKTIRLFPNKFGEFLCSDIGFSFVQKCSVPQHYSRGFDRPIYVYRKPLPEMSPPKEENTPNEALETLEPIVTSNEVMETLEPMVTSNEVLKTLESVVTSKEVLETLESKVMSKEVMETLGPTGTSNETLETSQSLVASNEALETLPPIVTISKTSATLNSSHAEDSSLQDLYTRDNEVSQNLVAEKLVDIDTSMT